MEQKEKLKLKTKETGNKGELICARYLKSEGFTLIAMNYQKKWGEIDVIVQKANKIHFVEVKTVSYETKDDLDYAVAHGTWRPEDNVHQNKLIKLSRVIQTWIIEHKWSGDFQIDVAAIRIVPRETYARINIIENIIL